MDPELDLYIALEDPISWLLLAYIKEELADYYNIQLKVFHGWIEYLFNDGTQTVNLINK